MKLKSIILAALLLLAVALPVAATYVPMVPHTIALSTTSARNTLPLSHPYLIVYSETGFFYKLGDSSVTATTSDHYVPPGNPRGVERPPGRAGEYIAVISASGTDTVYISEFR